MNRAPRSHRTVDLALLAVAIGWGSSYLAAKEVVTPDGVFAFLVLRFAVAAVGLAIVLAPRLRYVGRAEVNLGVLFGLILSVVLTLETFGVVRTSASSAGLIISLTIVMTPLCEQRIRHTHLPPAFYGAAVVAVAGVGLLTQAGGFAAPNLGDLLILLAAGARAVHVTVIAHLSEGRNLDSGRVTLVQLCTGLVVFAILSPLTGRGVGEVAAQLTTRSWLLIGYLALVCTVFAFVVQMWAVRRTSPETPSPPSGSPGQRSSCSAPTGAGSSIRAEPSQLSPKARVGFCAAARTTRAERSQGPTVSQRGDCSAGRHRRAHRRRARLQGPRPQRGRRRETPTSLPTL